MEGMHIMHGKNYRGKKGRSTNEYFGEDLEIIVILVIYHTGKRK